ncbi:MAG: TonB-dependent receptor plug domain-containing protein [Bacteroidales bacterium]|nr:TonB-dependent receptor plug domain-containing protein [Bacteroidales bacterium]
MKKAVISLLLVCLCHITGAQERTVNGKVTAFRDYPLKNVMVTSKATKDVAVTDSTGFFSIRSGKGDVLSFQSKAFESVKKVVHSEESVIVNMIFKGGRNNQKLAVETGNIDPDDLAYAVANLSDRNNDFYTYKDIYELIRGKFAGVDVMDDGKIRIRGQNQSFMLDDSALLIVDGVETPSISSIHPAEVASIEILKGSEASIYGSRGANGVVIITLVR